MIRRVAERSDTGGRPKATMSTHIQMLENIPTTQSIEIQTLKTTIQELTRVRTFITDIEETEFTESELQEVELTELSELCELETQVGVRDPVREVQHSSHGVRNAVTRVDDPERHELEA